ncbi:hypothetical protein SB767_20225 [Bacillus sp. SIMBA_069]
MFKLYKVFIVIDYENNNLGMGNVYNSLDLTIEIEKQEVCNG